MNKNRGLFLVKRDDSQVALYQDNNEIGFVSNDLKPRELYLRAKASEITYLPEIFYAQFLFFECQSGKLKCHRDKIDNQAPKKQYIHVFTFPV